MKLKRSYFKYLFSDRKSLYYWISLLIIILIITFITQLMHQDTHLFWFQPMLVVVLFIVFYSQSYFKYYKYFIYQINLKYNNVRFKKGECDVEIFQTGFNTKPFKQNYEVTIKIPSRKIKCNYISTNDSFILFCKVFDFGVFQRHINPIIIKLNNNYDCNFKINKIRIILFEDTYYEGDSLNVIFKKNIDNLKKLSIIDFKKCLNQLSHKEKA